MLIKKRTYKIIYRNTVKKLETERKRYQNAPPKTIVGGNCPNYRWKTAIGKGARINACQTIAIQKVCQKYRQPMKLKEVGLDALPKTVP